MKTNITVRSLLRPAVLTACLLAAVWMPGTTSHAGQEKLAAKMTETSTEVLRTRDQLQTTMDALSALVRQKQGDLKPAYDAFCAEVAKTQAAASWTQKTAQEMATNSAVYFSDWAKELNGVVNESLRKKGLKRMKAVQEDYNDAAAALDKAGQKFAPLLSDLSDIQKILAQDLTEGGVKSLRGTVSSAEFNLRTLRRSINSAVEELAAVSKALRPETR